jgi:hypothetical protein
MSQHKPAAPSAASVKAMASEFYGMTLDDKRAAQIADELAQFAAGAKAAGAVVPEAAPGALFRQLLLAHEPQGVRRA